MNRVLHLIVLLFISINLFAQAPQKMTYQAVIRNASNNLVVSSPVKMKISILQGSISGTAVYSELHNPTTNANGLVSIEIGSGTSPVGAIGSINWGNGTYFLKTETDPTNGTNYSIEGTSQLLSVPYALQANCVSSSLSGDTLTVGCKQYLIPGIVDLNETTGITSHSCGATNVHNSSIAYATMKDQEGNIYRTVKIGAQTWMAENLKTTKYRNGVSIPNITDNTQWQNNTTGAYCNYSNNASNDCPYGKLYNWYAVANSNGICPAGWHVPTDAEWNVLVKFLDINSDTTCTSCTQSSIAGGKMKNSGTSYWPAPNGSATNSSGLSALPGGHRDLNGSYLFVNNGYYWTSTETIGNINNAWSRDLNNLFGNINKPNYNKRFGFSVRCVKD
jgi:uncharacterized protein (TIGR02145 family)